ncbi:hypothetical protein SAMN05216525_13025 [Bradyrhizobium sp. Gha]|nr:hypothetical protein SAMN05216525_13025 [Bradyrhizobium sp. Gha]
MHSPVVWMPADLLPFRTKAVDAHAEAAELYEDTVVPGGEPRKNAARYQWTTFSAP